MNQETLSCSFCKYNYNLTSRIPLIISCGHSICRKCLIYISKKNNKIICEIDNIEIKKIEITDFP